MKKPRSGWPKYKNVKKKSDPDFLDFGRLASVFIVWGIIGLLTSWYFSHNFNPRKFSIEKPFEQEVDLNLSRAIEALGSQESPSLETENQKNIIGPINVKRNMESYEISLWANLPVQSWSFIEGEVLNAEKEYLFSFGKELWHETGRDSDGAWRENKNTYSMKVTFPKKGKYFLHFKGDGNKKPSHLSVTITKKRGSSLPHFWFGIISLIIGVVLNEMKNRTIIKVLDELS